MGDTAQIQSSVLKLETLKTQFSLVLNKYKQIYANYQSQIKSSGSSKYVSLNGRTYWGTSGITTTTSSTITECQALCSSNSKCSGAIWNKSNNSCNLRSGYSGVTPGSLLDYAIVPPAQLYLGQLRDLNAQLTNLHSQIISALLEINPTYQKVVTNDDVKGKYLNNVYSTLMQEKIQIDDLLAEYNTLDHVQNDTALQVESNYSYYRIFIIISIIVIFFVMKQLVVYSASLSEMRGGGKKLTYDILFNLILMILMLFLANEFQHSAGYILWSIFVLAYVFMKIKALPKFK